MKYKINVVRITPLLMMLLASNTFAEEETPRQSLKTNGTIVYNEKIKSVDNFSDMFESGEFYGRLRSNTFYFQWDHSNDKHPKQTVSGVGASMVYKSAEYYGFDTTVALYGSKSFFDKKNIGLKYIKSGKDTLSRYEYARTGSTTMGVIGQVNLAYTPIKGTKLVLGRQFFESFYTKSNDTKMIPNTFDGLSATTKTIDKNIIKVAYLAKQKLRDHTTSHSVLMYDDRNTSVNTNWHSNDDSVMHKGLSYTNLVAKGKPTDAPLIVAEVKNSSIKNLTADLSSYYVPSLLSQVMAELNYKINLGSFSITPGVRYIKQFDNGAGDVGGASISAESTGYKDPTSLEAQMIATRLVTEYENFTLNLGYTNILDEADLVTPWRGFPTAGYTRSMGIANWRANTQTYRAELVVNANKRGIYKDAYIQTSVLYLDADELKGGKDKIYYYIGFVQNIPAFEDLQWRLRAGYSDFTNKDDAEFNYLDTRFELNYLF